MSFNQPMICFEIMNCFDEIFFAGIIALLGKYNDEGFIFQSADIIPDLMKDHYTFSFACTPSYIYFLRLYH